MGEYEKLKVHPETLTGTPALFVISDNTFRQVCLAGFVLFSAKQFGLKVHCQFYHLAHLLLCLKTFKQLTTIKASWFSNYAT